MAKDGRMTETVMVHALLLNSCLSLRRSLDLVKHLPSPAWLVTVPRCRAVVRHELLCQEIPIRTAKSTNRVHKCALAALRLFKTGASLTGLVYATTVLLIGPDELVRSDQGAVFEKVS